MNLFLTSQGIQPELKNDFLRFLTKPAKDIKVLKVVTAACENDGPRPEWLEVYRRQLNDCGITQIEDLDIRGKNEKQLEQIASGKDLIFVNGGNTFFLLYWVKKTGFDKVIKRHLAGNGIYAGVSAGSYIACPTIEQSNWKNKDNNKIGLKDLSALNLIPFLITAHYLPELHTLIKEAAKTTYYTVAAINDTQAVKVTGNKSEIVGRGEKVLFNGFI